MPPIEYESPLPDPSVIRPLMLITIAVGTVIRVWIAGITDGTNDARIWYGIASAISEKGLIEAYRSLPELNHPPLAAIWSWVALQAGVWFTFVIKIPAIFGDALSVALLGKIWLERGDPPRARAAMIAMALSPIAILISGYHCNTDSLYAFFSLLAMYLMGMRGSFFLGGLALGAAINVKLIPVLLIPVALSLCRSWRDLLNLVCALALAALPFLPLALLAPDAVRRNMLSYVPVVGRWGIAEILYNLFEHPRFTDTALGLMREYQVVGRWAIIVVVIAVSFMSWALRKWNAFELGTLVYAGFLVLAPGFGSQYMVILVPLMLAVNIPRSWLYAVLGGIYLLLMYGAYLQPDAANPDRLRRPFLTIFPRSGPAPGAPFGLLAWWALAVTTVQIILKRQPPSHRDAGN